MAKAKFKDQKNIMLRREAEDHDRFRVMTEAMDISLNNAYIAAAEMAESCKSIYTKYALKYKGSKRNFGERDKRRLKSEEDV